MHQNPKVERFILYVLLMRPDKVDYILGRVTPGCFNHVNRKIFLACLDLQQQGRPVSALTLLNDSPGILTSEILDIVQGDEDTWPLVANPIHTDHVLDDHLKQLIEAHVRNQVLEKSSTKADLSVIVEQIQSLENQGLTRLYPSQILAAKVYESLHNQQAGLSFPLTLLNVASPGIRPGDVVIVAGRPGAGKSSLLQNLAQHFLHQNKKVLFASAEMSGEMITKRMLSAMSHQDFFSKHFRSSEETDQAFDRFSQLDFYIQELSNISDLAESLRSRIKETDVVIVDYLQLFEPSRKYHGLYERATYAINELVSLAKKHNIPIVIASQYSRQAELNQPTMADLRDSGQIEQAADMIISLWSKKEEAKNTSIQKVYLDVLKNRNGQTLINTNGYEYAVSFDKKYFEFSDWRKN